MLVTSIFSFSHNVFYPSQNEFQFPKLHVCCRLQSLFSLENIFLNGENTAVTYIINNGFHHLKEIFYRLKRNPSFQRHLLFTCIHTLTKDKSIFFHDPTNMLTQAVARQEILYRIFHNIMRFEIYYSKFA